MADEEQNEETTEETPAPEEAAAEAPAEEAAEAPAEETPAEEAPAEPAAAEAPAEPAPAAPDEGSAEAEGPVHPKVARKRSRSEHTGEAGPQRTIEDRAAERLAKRAKNAAERRRYRAKKREKHRAGGPREGTPKGGHAGTGSRRERLGVVVSDKADKTITVRIDTARQHRTYGKIVRSSTTLHAHDEANEANAGDTVRVVESRPLSRTKRWRLVEILERAR
jgi:small subunit ribosomal protein S17